jgi:hypothetical protein
LNFTKLNKYLTKFEDAQTIESSNLSKILKGYDESTNSFTYNLNTENVYREGFENYGKLTLSSNNANDIKIDSSGSYLFKNASSNTSNAIVSLKNLELGFSDAEALGLIANDNLKSNYTNNFTNSKNIIENILKVAINDFKTTDSNLKSIDENLSIGVDSIKEFVGNLNEQNQNIKDAISLTKTIYEKNALIPSLGEEGVYKTKLDLEKKFMKLLLASDKSLNEF